MVVPITSDKGLCGGINSSVSKYARALLSMDGQDGAYHRCIIRAWASRIIQNMIMQRPVPEM